MPSKSLLTAGSCLRYDVSPQGDKVSSRVMDGCTSIPVLFVDVDVDEFDREDWEDRSIGMGLWEGATDRA